MIHFAAIDLALTDHFIIALACLCLALVFLSLAILWLIAIDWYQERKLDKFNRDHFEKKVGLK